MKKKILAIALAVALLAIVVSGSLAYFTAQDKVTNTFTVGSVKIEIYENEEATEEDVIEFGKLVPVVNTADPADDESYLEKVVDVKNIGNNDAYIRTHIAIPTALVGYLHLDLTETGWVRQADSAATVDGIAYTVYTWDHTAAVTPDSFTNELLQGVYLGADVDLEENAEGNLVFILRDSTGKKSPTPALLPTPRLPTATPPLRLTCWWHPRPSRPMASAMLPPPWTAALPLTPGPTDSDFTIVDGRAVYDFEIKISKKGGENK